jgi:hypothetical protein
MKKIRNLHNNTRSAAVLIVIGLKTAFFKHLLIMPNHTTEDLLQYVYGETSQENSASIEKALFTDWALKEKVDLLNSCLQELDGMVTSPRPQSVMAILDYARASAEVV